MGKDQAHRSDQELVEAYRMGSKDAMGELVRRYQVRCFRRARSITHDDSLAEEACQEAWLRCIRSISSYDVNRPFFPWMARIVTNVARNLVRTRHITFVSLDELCECGSESDVLAESELDLEELERLRRAFAKLSDADKTILAAIHIEGYSAAEAAVTLRVSKVAARVRSMRARQRLRRLFENEP